MPAVVQDSEIQAGIRIGDFGAVPAAEVLRSGFGFAKGVVEPQPRTALWNERPRRVTCPAARMRAVQLRNPSSGEVRGRDGPIA